ncbi:hypothetical protein A2V49_04150 [candidate division WWE3 bacterium RBG_19FT_COMBO_34_6]|uniref:Uncharacterized protein n=1 Tax=candidate division WWE3 bacterium RBG_19FT_COMBO_34_6 TaxID=1802612 RepID=A0A1F4ULP8_UNCKA|nr:MAG: hypothetical protein A2V49_04150 [candidate division WWE3 bacterium RBG_19FT_COMBO_34_6]
MASIQERWDRQLVMYIRLDYYRDILSRTFSKEVTDQIIKDIKPEEIVKLPNKENLNISAIVETIDQIIKDDLTEIDEFMKILSEIEIIKVDEQKFLLAKTQQNYLLKIQEFLKNLGLLNPRDEKILRILIENASFVSIIDDFSDNVKELTDALKNSLKDLPENIGDALEEKFAEVPIEISNERAKEVLRDFLELLIVDGLMKEGINSLMDVPPAKLSLMEKSLKDFVNN